MSRFLLCGLVSALAISLCPVAFGDEEPTSNTPPAAASPEPAQAAVEAEVATDKEVAETAAAEHGADESKANGGEEHAAEHGSDAEAKGGGDAHGDHQAGDDHSAAEHGGAKHGSEDHGDGEHHDPHDLSHVNAGAKLHDADEFKSELAIWTFVVFLCLLAILGKFAWGPIMEGLEKREQSIAAMIEEAKQSQEKAAEQLKQYEAKIAAAGEESREIVAQARKDAEAAGERIVAAAEAAAEKQRERAVADIANAKNAALNEIKTEGVNLAVQLAGRIVRRELNSQDHSQLIDEALKQLPSRN